MAQTMQLVSSGPATHPYPSSPLVVVVVVTSPVLIVYGVCFCPGGWWLVGVVQVTWQAGG